MSVSTNCGKIVNGLRLTGKEVFSVHDIRTAVIDGAGVQSQDGIDNYLGNTGHLRTLGYIQRCQGGWKLAGESKTSGMIIVKVTPQQNTAEVFNVIGAATKRFGSVVEISMEV